MSDVKNNPIGIFDSGIGGLTVVKRMFQFLPNENTVYFGDTARVPYGSKSNSTVIEYSLQDGKFLIDKNVKIIVVACNTASSVALDELSDKFNVPIIGMIEPGAKLALSKTVSGRIGVIGTNATVNNKAYSKELKKLNPKVEVFEKSCPLFVPLAEEGWLNHKATLLIAEEYLHELKEHNIDTLILGCTHYPILAEIIHKVMGPEIHLIDSGTAASIIVKDYLIENDLLSDENKNPVHNFYVSDVPSKFKEVAELFLGTEVENLTKIDLEELIH
ncbi:MAG: glutamate racemase [Melioribacteraceae bacterium]|nr:glutamate racemase [Melioribacteraceae bacterium]